MTTTTTITTGAKVQGSYHGVAYRGTVEQHRPHTMNANAEMFIINLDTPITVFGATRDSLALTVGLPNGDTTIQPA